ncbi:DUF485 domain-containing protein [Bacillus sp. FJAT-50079]|uniref:DUF485 domain-containing protein n=1 Tax=Bacillus sp. FJAT-50079 TaxID=2833577 RepID=UPI001BC94750|nr:DUF485 domain-containing protein [Bacillus sp. FJAT-50079]MBS4208029.1 DUF485 domain-containing protein [Bacillus sp. FJAT-50079]
MKKRDAIDFEKVEKSTPFQQLMAAKKTFFVPSITLFVGLYLVFPILISYTNVLEKFAIGDISWVWIYALFLFIMTWVLATIYMKKSAAFDRLAEKVWEEEEQVEGRRAR